MKILKQKKDFLGRLPLLPEPNFGWSFGPKGDYFAKIAP